MGILGSLAAWALIAFLAVPKIKISTINVVADATVPTGCRYRIKIQNGRLSAVGDLSVNARVVLGGLHPGFPGNRTSLRLPVRDGDTFPVLARRPWLPATFDSHRFDRLLTLQIQNLTGGGMRHLPVEVRERLARGEMRLEEVMYLGTHPYVRIAVAATHAFSGVRRTWVVTVRAYDFERGKFKRNSIQVVPDTPGNDD